MPTYNYDRPEIDTAIRLYKTANHAIRKHHPRARLLDPTPGDSRMDENGVITLRWEVDVLAEYKVNSDGVVEPYGQRIVYTNPL